MAHTYGEVLPPSFPDIFRLAADPSQTVFVDAGSGYGALLIDSVQTHGFLHAVGIEKYKDKYDASLHIVRQLPHSLQQKVTIVLQDINDTDLTPLLSRHNFDTLLFFCNNVAFNSGTIHRYNSNLSVYPALHSLPDLTKCCLAGLATKSDCLLVICKLQARSASWSA